MDVKHLLDYHVWADKHLKGALAKVSDEDFVKSTANVRSLQELLAHYVTSYDYLIVSPDKLQERMNALDKMNRVELLKEWDESQTEFYKQAMELKGDITIPSGKNKTMTLNRDNYLLLYTDHLTYHRSQFTQTIKTLGYEGPNTDYYTFASDQ